MNCEDRCLKKIEDVQAELDSVKRILSAIVDSQNLSGVLKCELKPEIRHVGTGMFRRSFGMDTYLYVYERAKEHRILLKELTFNEDISLRNTIFDIDGDYVKFSVKTYGCCTYCYTVNYKNGSYIYEKKYDE